MLKKALVAAAVATVALTGAAQARDQIRIVGSSTVFPFSTAVAERFGRTTDFKTPIVESTGSGGGLKLFCSGSGDQHPDITNASRRIKASEVERCAENGIHDIVEVKVGYDGIVIANSRKSGLFEISLRDVYLALAKDVPTAEGTTVPNPNVTWKDVNPALPDVKIEVLGPPPTSGTRDAFAELALEGGCKTFDWVKDLKKTDKTAYKALCHTVREDGAYVEAGENDNLIVQKLDANPKALGVFGYSFLDQNTDLLQGSVVNGQVPTFENIAAGDYPVSRPLFFYVKRSRIGAVPGIEEFIAEFASDKAWGPDGYLADKGLIPMSEEERESWSNKARSLADLVM
jgi:phosphate transport system substrate-binding protein